MIGRVLALAFGIMKVTDLAREVVERVTDRTPQPYLKSAFATALAAGTACAYADTWRERAELAGALAGTAAVLHEGYALLSTGADSNKAMVVQRASGAALRSVGSHRHVQPL